MVSFPVINKVNEMAVSEEKASVPEVSQRDLDWMGRRIDRIWEQIYKDQKKLKLLIALLVDKKVIGGELAKQIQETLFKGEDKASLLEWFKAEMQKT